MKIIVATTDVCATALQLKKCFGGDWRCEEKTKCIIIGGKPHQAISFFNMNAPYNLPLSRIVNWIISYDLDFEKVVFDSMMLHSKLISPKEMAQLLIERAKNRKAIEFKKAKRTQNK